MCVPTHIVPGPPTLSQPPQLSNPGYATASNAMNQRIKTRNPSVHDKKIYIPDWGEWTDSLFAVLASDVLIKKETQNWAML